MATDIVDFHPRTQRDFAVVRPGTEGSPSRRDRFAPASVQGLECRFKIVHAASLETPN